MTPILHSEAQRTVIAPGRERYLSYTDHLMMTVIDFNDGPSEKPDSPHNHPHEQITYVAEGKVLFFLGDASYKLSAGDMITVPPNIPHCIQLLTPYVRLVDTFSPIREEFLNTINST
jgi:quercetin dioxygenase-like cupin family protein